MAFRRLGKTPEIPASLHLPPVLYNMFSIEDSLKFLPKPIPANYGRKVNGIAGYMALFDKATETKPEDYRIVKRENKFILREKEKIKAAAEYKKKLERAKLKYNPKEEAKKNPQKYTKNAVNTLFVGRLSYKTKEETLKKIFEKYGNVVSIKIIENRGYAFVEFENQDGLKQAYRKANRLKIDGKEILTDVERGRTVPSWLPMRLGGGRGGSSRRPRKTRKRQRTPSLKLPSDSRRSSTRHRR